MSLPLDLTFPDCRNVQLQRDLGREAHLGRPELDDQGRIVCPVLLLIAQRRPDAIDYGARIRQHLPHGLRPGATSIRSLTSIMGSGLKCTDLDATRTASCRSII